MSMPEGMPIIYYPKMSLCALCMPCAIRRMLASTQKVSQAIFAPASPYCKASAVRAQS